MPLEIQLTRGEGWDPINRFNPTTCLCLLLFCNQEIKLHCMYTIKLKVMTTFLSVVVLGQKAVLNQESDRPNLIMNKCPIRQINHHYSMTLQKTDIPICQLRHQYCR